MVQPEDNKLILITILDWAYYGIHYKQNLGNYKARTLCQCSKVCQFLYLQTHSQSRGIEDSLYKKRSHCSQIFPAKHLYLSTSKRKVYANLSLDLYKIKVIQTFEACSSRLVSGNRLQALIL